MARKVEKPQPKASAPQGADATDAAELEILHPERTIKVGGKAITLNELTFGDSLRLHAQVAPIVAGIEQMMRDRGNDVPQYRDTLGVFAANLDATFALMAVSAGCDEAWLRSLGSADGDLVMLTFWTANAGFFIQRAANDIAIQAESERMLANVLAGANSSQPSSPTATAAPTSPDTPPAS